MRIFLSGLIGAVVGFCTVFFSKNKLDEDWFHVFEIPVAIALIIINLVLIAITFYWRKKALHLTKLNVKGEEEDLVDDQKYNWSNNYTMYANAGLILGLVGIAYAAILDLSGVILVSVMVVIIINIAFTLSIPSFLNKLNPERKYPSINDKKYAEKILEMADEGERQVILVGLYKTYNLVVFLCSLGIVASIIYSVMTDTSQLFSIFVLGIILIVSQLKYSLSVRRKG